MIWSTFACGYLKDTIFASKNRCVSLSKLFFPETFTETEAVFQSRNLISAAKLQLISRRCSSELFVNISADGARRRTSISARPRWPPRRCAAGTRRRDERRVTEGRETSRSSLAARRQRVNGGYGGTHSLLDWFENRQFAVQAPQIATGHQSRIGARS